jgi:AraC family transcriptional regulator
MDAFGDVPTKFRWRGPGLLLPDDPCNFVIRMYTRAAYFPEHDGYLSLKFAHGGRELYHSEGKTVAVHEGSYLLLNHGQRYASEVENDSVVESLAIFFDPAFAADVLSSLSSASDRLLDPPRSSPHAVHFFDQLYPSASVIGHGISDLTATLASRPVDPDWLAEWFASTLERLLLIHRGLRPEIDRLDAVKSVTRAELYRRLCWGRDYLDTCFNQPVTVAQAAAVACLSRYRFLRLFGQAFGETPHRYLTNRRLREARRLLSKSDISVTQVCLSVGFESLGSFSTLFKNRVGSSPGEWRRANSARSPYLPEEDMYLSSRATSWDRL